MLVLWTSWVFDHSINPVTVQCCALGQFNLGLHCLLKHVFLSYRNDPKISDTQDLDNYCSKILRKWISHTLVHPNDAKWTANVVDPDQTCSFRGSLIWVFNVCSDLSVQIFRVITVILNGLYHRFKPDSIAHYPPIVLIWLKYCWKGYTISSHIPPSIHQSIYSQQAHNVKMTSYWRRCNVITSHRRQNDVISTSCACWAKPDNSRYLPKQYIFIITTRKSKDIWAATWQNQQSGRWAQWRLRSAWSSAQSDQSLHGQQRAGLNP